MSINVANSPGLPSKFSARLAAALSSAVKRISIIYDIGLRREFEESDIHFTIVKFG